MRMSLSEKMPCAPVAVLLLLCALPLCMSSPETVDHGAASHKAAPMVDGLHNPVFDQEALLGSQNVREELEDLPEDVRHKRLTNLAKSHDANDDGIIEPEELKAWVVQSFGLVDREEAAEKFQEDDENNDGKITFEELVHKQFGYTQDDLKELNDKEEEDKDVLETLRLIEDDKRRFEAADLNKDESLDEEEFRAFFLPYNYPHMFPLEMERAMKDLDKDSDGFVSMEEFVGGEDVDDESRMVEMTHFEDLDKDKDGKLSSEEVRPWALSDNEEIAKEEVDHLMEACDLDGDGKLSIEEIVSKEEEFMSSSATDYGRIVHFVKDEL